MSFYLSRPQAAGLMHPRSDRRQIIHPVQVAVKSNLIAFLMQDCCDERSEICTAVLPKEP